MRSSNETQLKLIIHDTISKIKSIKSEIAIVVVANVKNKTNTDDYDRFSVATDFFSETELDEIIKAFREFGFYVEVYTDETDFIKDVVETKLESIPRKHKLVYNTSQKGTGAARQSLIPAFCKLYKIPYIGSNAYVSSLCRHKYHYNKLLSNFHSHLPKSWQFESPYGWLLNLKPDAGLKVILKPVYEAASIGISYESILIYSEKEDEKIRQLSDKLGQPIAIEEFIEGYEVEVPVLMTNSGNFGLGPVGISLNGEKRLGEKILDYDDVYDDKYAFYVFNELPEQVREEILWCTQQCAEILGIEDYGRIDFRITNEGTFYLMDITTNPHTVLHSSCNFAFKSLGFNHSELMSTLAGFAVTRYNFF